MRGPSAHAADAHERGVTQVGLEAVLSCRPVLMQPEHQAVVDDEQRAELAAWFHGWEDDQWDEQMKRDIADGKLDLLLHEVEDDIRAGRFRDMP